MLGSGNLNKNIEEKVNQHYPESLKAFLNTEKLLSIKDIAYSFNNVNLTVAHNLSLLDLDSKGLKAFFEFGVMNSSRQQDNCSKLPAFNEESFGGVQEIITFNSLKFLIL
jgi:hypothetical protein